MHGASKVVWGVPVANADVEAHFGSYLPQVRAALARIPQGEWREFAAFAGPELASLTAWGGKVVLVGDSSHALSGAFGSGAGFAMEDGWVVAQALRRYGAWDDKDGGRRRRAAAAALFDRIRVPYYSRMYEYLGAQAAKRAARLAELEATEGGATEEERVRVKTIREGKDMGWIYQHDIGRVWEETVAQLDAEEKKSA